MVIVFHAFKDFNKKFKLIFLDIRITSHKTFWVFCDGTIGKIAFVGIDIGVQFSPHFFKQLFLILYNTTLKAEFTIGRRSGSKQI